MRYPGYFDLWLCACIVCVHLPACTYAVLRCFFFTWTIYIGASLVTLGAYGHTTLNAPVLVRSPKLSSVGPAQYLDGWPPGNSRCCRLLLVFVFEKGKRLWWDHPIHWLGLQLERLLNIISRIGKCISTVAANDFLHLYFIVEVYNGMSQYSSLSSCQGNKFRFL